MGSCASTRNDAVVRCCSQRDLFVRLDSPKRWTLSCDLTYENPDFNTRLVAADLQSFCTKFEDTGFTLSKLHGKEEVYSTPCRYRLHVKSPLNPNESMLVPLPTSIQNRLNTVLQDPSKFLKDQDCHQFVRHLLLDDVWSQKCGAEDAGIGDVITFHKFSKKAGGLLKTHSAIFLGTYYGHRLCLSKQGSEGPLLVTSVQAQKNVWGKTTKIHTIKERRHCPR